MLGEVAFNKEPEHICRSGLSWRASLRPRATCAQVTCCLQAARLGVLRMPPLPFNSRFRTIMQDLSGQSCGPRLANLQDDSETAQTLAWIQTSIPRAVPSRIGALVKNILPLPLQYHSWFAKCMEKVDVGRGYWQHDAFAFCAEGL